MPSGIGETPLVIFATADESSPLWVHTDNQGSPIAWSGPTGTQQGTWSYDAFGLQGQPTSSAEQYTYTGQTCYCLGALYNYKARTYDPNFGRFLEADPIGQAGGINTYAYVGNDPLNGSDPTGLESIPDPKKDDGRSNFDSSPPGGEEDSDPAAGAFGGLGGGSTWSCWGGVASYGPIGVTGGPAHCGWLNSFGGPGAGYTGGALGGGGGDGGLPKAQGYNFCTGDPVANDPRCAAGAAAQAPRVACKVADADLAAATDAASAAGEREITALQLSRDDISDKMPGAYQAQKGTAVVILGAEEGAAEENLEAAKKEVSRCIP